MRTIPIPDPAAIGSEVPASSLITKFNNTAESYNAIRLAVTETIGIAQKYYDMWEQRNRWSIRISSNDSLYYYVAEWAATTVNPKRRAPITAGIHSDGIGYTIKTKYDFSQDGGYFKVGNNIVFIEADEPAPTKNVIKSSDSILPSSITIHCKSKQARQEVLDFFLHRVRAANVVNNNVYLWNIAYGEWTRSSFVPRPFDSVILADDISGFILKDVNHFFESEERYAEMGIHWHRGYLLYGPPGTGKSSLATALATEYNMPLYYLTLSSVKDDQALIEAVSSVGKRSILLLEDVDVFNATGERNSEGGLSLAALLNVLDGVVTPYGLMTIMTTNSKESLDPALIRPGRADVSLEIGYPDGKQREKIIRRFSPEVLAVNGFDVYAMNEVSAAAIVSAIKEHFDRPAVELASALMKLE